MEERKKGKYKVLEIDTEKGTVSLKLQPILDMDGITEMICETRCPYHKVCEHLPNPRKDATPQNNTFLHFCGSLGEGENEDVELRDCVPAPGSLEEAFKDVFDKDIYQLLVDGNPVVPVKDLIKTVCSGFCDFYDPVNFSKCKSSNQTCLLHDLFKIAPGELKPEEVKEDKEPEKMKVDE